MSARVARHLVWFLLLTIGLVSWVIVASWAWDRVSPWASVVMVFSYSTLLAWIYTHDERLW